MDKIILFNNDQIEHIQLVQKSIWAFCNKLMNEAITHDKSKFSEVEYKAFVESRDSLRGSIDGKDEDYQKHFKSEAIQHHVLNNSHHPEYWDARNERMPLHEIIAMYFDWQSRAIAKGQTMEGFWEYNLAKLFRQPHAIPIVAAMREEYGP